MAGSDSDATVFGKAKSGALVIGVACDAMKKNADDTIISNLLKNVFAISCVCEVSLFIAVFHKLAGPLLLGDLEFKQLLRCENLAELFVVTHLYFVFLAFELE